MKDASPEMLSIFCAALERGSAEERADYLAGACGPDAESRARIEALLRAHDRAGGFLPEQTQASAATAVTPPGAELVGTMIGPYKLMEQIGEGGMGLVFVAEQQRPVRRKVALKVIKPGMDSRQVVARFEAERQALALMDHPNIAKVHDGGTTEAGRPYFVMELVKGVPVTDYCDQNRLTTRRRLELFVSVCQAVQHAHQKGVIHRDLKPSNVLVAVHDVTPVVKVIDFGIAKATGQQLTEKTLYTGLAQLVGTPLYMSPEQAGQSSLDVDTRSDVYALGVLLYELLTGTTPFAGETLRRVGHDEMRRMIREDEPPRPSTRLSTLQQAALSTVAECRGVEPPKLRQQVRGELDWVVMKALEKDRNRRYESASALAADVLRYLNDEPVEACPPTAGYRLRKFWRQNRRLLATAGTVGVALAVATAVSTWQAVKARNAEDRAATEAAVAHAVNDFLQHDLLGQVGRAPPPDVESHGNQNLTVRQALDRAAARIGDRFADQPLVEAAVRTTIGAGYNNVSQWPRAVRHLERAVELRRTHLGADQLDTVISMSTLADAYSWVGRHDDAIALRRQILKSFEQLFGPDHPEILGCVAGLAGSLNAAGQWDTGIPLLEQVLDKQRALYGPTHFSTLGTMHGLAMHYKQAGRLADSLALHGKVLQLYKSTLGPENRATIWCMLSYAQLCQRVGKLDRAECELRHVLQDSRKRTDSMGRIRTGNTLGWLAYNRVLQQKFDEAEPLIRETVAIFEKEQPDSDRRFYWVSLLGDVLAGQKKYAEAEPFLLQGFEGMRERQAAILAGQRPRFAEAGERIVRFYEASNQPEKAQEWRAKVQANSAETAVSDISANLSRVGSGR